MTTESLTCLINESDCGRAAGNPVCPKCGMDERVVYPGQADLAVAQAHAKRIYLERELKNCLDSKSQEFEDIQKKYDSAIERLSDAETELTELKWQKRNQQLLVDEVSGATVVRAWLAEVGLSKDDVLKNGVSIVENFFAAQFLRVWIWVALLAMVLLLIACGKKEETFPWESQITTDMSDEVKTKLSLELCKDSYYFQKRHLVGNTEKAVSAALLTCAGLLVWIVVRMGGLFTINIHSDAMQINRAFRSSKRIHWQDIERCEYAGGDLWRVVAWKPDSDLTQSPSTEFVFRIGGKSNVKGYTQARGLALINHMISRRGR